MYQEDELYLRSFHMKAKDVGAMRVRGSVWQDEALNDGNNHHQT
jgi:hypothetical protein